jgi:hypothetical protein
MMPSNLVAGAATTDITPEKSQFLLGYPHVERMSTGVHDRLLSSALYLYDGQTALLIVANDVVMIGNETVRHVRERIEKATGVPAANIMVTATHTHSGPITVDLFCCENDAVVPKVDPAYLRHLEQGIVTAAVQACRNPRPAVVGLAIADGSCVGTNRHDPTGPSNPEAPVLLVRDRDRQAFLAAMIVGSMHPTVLHEDSKLVSGDFPSMMRSYLQEHVLGNDCPVLYHTGPAGDQSPRHVTRSNTFEEATRLGHLFGQSIAKAIDSLIYTDDILLSCARELIDLPERSIPTVDRAQQQHDQAVGRLESLRRSEADSREIRTAECDWFGAEETLALAKAASSGRLREVLASVMPAEVSLMRIGPWAFAGWPGEVFVEFALQVKASCPNCYVIELANGELQSYLVTEEAVRKGWYEANNALLASPDAGMKLVETTLKLFNKRS